MTTVSIQEAQAKLPELIASLAPGETLIITKDQLPIARLQAVQKARLESRKAGSARGLLTILQDDDAHLQDFNEYT